MEQTNFKPSAVRLQGFDALRMVSWESYHLSPRKVGLLVSGLLLVCCWRYLAASVEAFDALGLQCLLQLWTTAVLAYTLGHTAKYLTSLHKKQQHAAGLDDDAQSDISSEDSSSINSPSGGLQQLYPLKEGVELRVPQYDSAASAVRHGLRIAGQEQEQEEDMATLKRRAQEEASAKLAQYRAVVQQRLASIRQAARSTTSSINAQLLHGLADELFASPMNLSAFVELGGVAAVLEALRAVTKGLQQALRQQQQPRELQAAATQPQPPLPWHDALTASLPALLQVSWVLLQVSQGPAACKAELQSPECSAALLAAAQAVAALPPSAARATESTLRNLWWTLLALCDREPTAATSSSSSSSSSAGSIGSRTVFQQQLLQQYADAGAVQQLQQLLCLQHGYSAGWVAAAHLGLLMQLGHHQRQQQQQDTSLQQAAAGLLQQQQQQQQPDSGDGSSALSALASAAVRAVLQDDSIMGLCCLMVHTRLEQHPADAAAQQQQLSGRMRSLVEGLLHYLLTFHATQLLQLLIEQQLVGCFALHSCTRLARLLVCQLLSSNGQKVLAAVEQDYELDVPLALAQVIPLQLHVKLPQAIASGAAAAAAAQPPACVEAAQAGPEEQQQHQQEQEQQQGLVDDLYTDVLACRLLLQHQRLWELLAVFCEDARTQQDAQQPQQQGSAGVQDNPVLAAAAAAVDWECSVVAAGLALVQHLMSRELQLQVPRHMRGDCVSDSLSGSSSSRSLQDALALPDYTGAYGRVLEGLVATEQLPAAGAGARATDVVPGQQGSSSHACGLSLPGLQPAVGQTGAARGAASAAPDAARQFVFQFGQLQHAVDAATFKQIRDCSSLVRSILGRVSCSSQQQQQPQPITVLAIPEFTHEANCWVLQCLERWLHSRALTGFSVMQAAQLWVAADFLQVDDLQSACEDIIAAAFREEPQHSMPLALELCAHHTDSGSRLLKLLVQQLLQQLCSGGNGSSRPQPGSSSAQAASGQARQQLRLLGQLLQHHEALLLPAMHAELRDRLATLCMLNAGAGDEDCDSVLA